ncbi:type II toxin-antitoxin system mRNA interferase toxin, RelE/StbE family [Candidatus Gottesmanbacteria bacterium]|nr:type II toxin-antitoxin system mRNA interferase toxin, RelE/StbE family [Candidatus Gottesmanbacteria bacterium]
MNVVYDPEFVKKLKKVNVKIKKSAKERILLFSKDPTNPQLNNHPLKREWEGYRSIDITADYRAIFKETQIVDEIVAYFVAFGTHKELYQKP